MRRLIALPLTIGLCAASTRAAAEPRSSSEADRHAKAGSRKGAIVADPDPESLRYAELVAAADADGDGYVSDPELTNLVREYVEKQVRARFARLDRNRDGRVVRAEVPQMVAARFARFDANGDGAFTAKELELVLQTQAVERCRSVFARLDTDGDGTLSAADAAVPTRVSKRESPARAERRRVPR